MDIEKLKETLKANGIEEEKIDKIIADLAEEDKPANDKPTDESPVEGKPAEDEPPAPTEEVEPTEVPPVDEVNGTNGEGELPPDGEVPPVPPTEEEVPPTEVPQTDVPPQEVPPAPQIDVEDLLAKIDTQQGVIDEQAKTIEGLGARIQSLEDALQSAGVLEKNDNEGNVGIDETRVPGSNSVHADSAMSSVLARLNGNKHI